mmetsp:Transcript_844/g.1521  ORF Transcript_844/g.1521 Transcript_844/m.1521 type:complete len:395 (-) Transcript_844:1676-2860(-)
MVSIDKILHASVQFVTNTKRIFDNDFSQMFDWATAALSRRKFLLPHSGAFQFVSGQDVVHNVSIQVLDDSVFVNVRRQQLRMDGIGTSITTDVEIVSVLCGNHTKIFALGFGTFSSTSRDGRLHLVRRSDTLVSVLDASSKRNRFLDTVSAPCRSDARFNGTKGLSVGMTGFEANLAKCFPNFGQFVLGSSKQIDALSTCNLAVQVVFLGHFTESDELFGSTFTGRHARNDRVRSTTLHVGQGAVVRVLEFNHFGADDHLVLQRGKDTSDGGFTQFASIAVSVLGQDLFKGIDLGWILFGSDKCHEFLTRVIEMLADVVGQGPSHGFKFGGKHLFDLRFASTASRSGLGALFDFWKRSAVHTKFTNFGLELSNGNVVTRTDLSVGVGQIGTGFF